MLFPAFEHLSPPAWEALCDHFWFPHPCASRFVALNIPPYKGPGCHPHRDMGSVRVGPARGHLGGPVPYPGSAQHSWCDRTGREVAPLIAMWLWPGTELLCTSVCLSVGQAHRSTSVFDEQVNE